MSLRTLVCLSISLLCLHASLPAQPPNTPSANASEAWTPERLIRILSQVHLTKFNFYYDLNGVAHTEKGPPPTKSFSGAEFAKLLDGARLKFLGELYPGSTSSPLHAAKLVASFRSDNQSLEITLYDASLMYVYLNGNRTFWHLNTDISLPFKLIEAWK